jgi:type IV pilus assembly protein PilX
MFVCNNSQLIQKKRQQGLVLFVALIALVAMSLAAAALIRSVDTSTIVAGNLALKQSATLAADSGLETAITWLTNNPSGVDADNKTVGYHATNTTLDFKDADLWVDANSEIAQGNGITAGKDDITGNEVRYIIQRMCSAAGKADATNCLVGYGQSDNGSKGTGGYATQGRITSSGISPMYRITARVLGPKNTISYIQAYLN